MKPNIYAFNLLKSTSVVFEQEDSFTISRILSLANSYTLQSLPMSDVCKKLLKIFEMGESETWSEVDRVCFIYRDSFSNQLRILSSEQNKKIKESRLVPGYSCVVDENSSLLSLKDGEIRIYNDIESVINSFAESGRKIQRSLGLIHETGVKSGLTIPLQMHNNCFGYLFLNSTSLNAFSQLKDQDYSILCLLKIVFENIQNHYFYKYIDHSLLNILSAIPNKNKIVFNSLQGDLQKLFIECFKMNIDVAVNKKVELNFLLPHRKFLLSTFLTLKQITNLNQAQNISLDITSNTDSELVTEILIDNGKKVEFNNTVDIKSFAEDLELKVDANKVTFILKYESSVDGLLYSV